VSYSQAIVPTLIETVRPTNGFSLWPTNVVSHFPAIKSAFRTADCTSEHAANRSSDGPTIPQAIFSTVRSPELQAVDAAVRLSDQATDFKSVDATNVDTERSTDGTTIATAYTTAIFAAHYIAQRAAQSPAEFSANSCAHANTNSAA
jgi:hypothetical protein